MKGLVKFLIGFGILGVIFFAVYTVLPEQPQSVVKGIFQPVVDSTAKERINAVKSMNNSDLNATYESILEANSGIGSWVYEMRADGTECVTYRCSGVYLNLKKWTDYNGMLSTDAQVKVEFIINMDGTVDVLPYVDGKAMFIDDIKFDASNKELKLDIFSQMYTGRILSDE